MLGHLVYNGHDETPITHADSFAWVSRLMRLLLLVIRG